MLRISVALCTLNGEKYLGDLLTSLIAQSLQPAELIVCDDMSSDQTMHVLRHFSQHASFPIRVHVNTFRMGVVQNFEQAISLCSGEIIALCDQDDVWHHDKLFQLSRALASQSALAAFSDALVVNKDLMPFNYTMWQRVRFTRQERARLAAGNGFPVLLKHNLVTGATLAFKSNLRKDVLPIPVLWPHDAWLATIAAAQDGLVAVNETLISYRQHAENVVGGTRRSFGEDARLAMAIDRTAWYRVEIDRWRTLQDRLMTFPVRQTVRLALAEKLAHLETRANLPLQRWRRIPGIFFELISGRYARHARNWGSVAIDLLVR